jgi:NADH-quinone oxidoreductase subunit G
VPSELERRFGAAGRLAAIVSPNLTVEEAFLLATYVRSLDPTARLALGPVPIVGSDETFKNGFTIRAEKCPNRRGVEEILRHFDDEVLSADALMGDPAWDEIGGLWVSGGYRDPAWINDMKLGDSVGDRVVVVQDLFMSEWMERATFELPAAAFAERAGSFVNHADRLQSFDWAVRPPQGVLTEGQLLWRLLDRPGLYDPKAVLAEIAATIPYFAPAANGVPATGVQLTAPQPIQQPA